MRIVATVDIMNRVAQSVGYGVSSSRITQPCRAVLTIRNRSDGRKVLVISTRRDVTGNEYDVQTIQKLRTQFVHQGLATIEISQPPLNIMLRNCGADELQEFLDTIRKFGNELIAGTGNSPAAPSPCRLSDPQQKENKTKTDGSLRKTGGAFKRPRYPDLSKSETAKLKKCLTTNLKAVAVKKRENYPKEFQSSLEQVKVTDIGLRKIDPRILKLKHLAILDLSGNSIKSIEPLTKLPSPSLHSLVLAKNGIFTLPWDIFTHAAFQKLQRLDLSRNLLVGLPDSLVDLENLIHLDLSGNNLICLPYNWICMKSLHVAKYPTQILPELTQKFLKASKYCAGCMRMSWRYKVSQFCIRASDLGVDVTQSPGRQTCVVKQIICFDCDIKSVNPRIVVPV